MNKILYSLVIVSLFASGTFAQQFQFKYVPSPIDNPLRGLVPYVSQMPWLDPNASDQQKKEYFKKYDTEMFPHSIEFNYFSMRELMPKEGSVDFAPIEKWIQQATSRGCQLTFRVQIEFPSEKEDQGNGIPQFLIDDGLKVIKWKNDDGQTIHAPDYKNPKMRAAIDLLIAKLGEKYDGDPRVACLTMGVLGHWGEWHSYPRDELFPKKEYQSHVMDQFEKAFTKTPVLMRYAAGTDDWSFAPNVDRPFGFHDDSFAWATVDTGKDEDDWFFMTKIKKAGAMDAWKTRMIGGEIRPEIWGCVFDDKSCEEKGQEFDRSVKATHATWLMDSGMFGLNGPPSAERVRNATKKVGMMGYEFHVPSASLDTKNGKTKVELKIENRGVAPLYANWDTEVAVLDSKGNIRKSAVVNWDLPSILPEKQVSRISTLDCQLNSGEVVAIRIVNPLEGGKRLRFANENQQLDGESWLLLK